MATSASKDDDGASVPAVVEEALPPPPEPEPEKVDVSIPYDAAARLAYDQWRTENEMEEDEATYAAFKSKYESLAVANVIAKKMEREIAALAIKKEAVPTL